MGRLIGVSTRLAQLAARRTLWSHDGLQAARRRRVTMKDVAAEAGVDASLVSRLLSGDETLSACGPRPSSG